MKKSQLNFLIFILFHTIFIDYLYSQNNDDFISIEKSNAHIEIGNRKDIFKKWKLKNIKEKRIPLNLGFMNNPFHLDNSYEVLIILNHDLIFDGRFTEYGIKVLVPTRLLSKKVQPFVIVYKKNKSFIFSCDSCLRTILKTDNMIQVIFMPTNDSMSMYLITTDWKLNEN